MNRGKLIGLVIGAFLLSLLYTNTVGAVTWKPTYAQEFNSTSIPTDWNIRQVKNHLSTHMSFNENGLSVKDGNLVIKTTRHCVSNRSEKLDASNASEYPCPAGKITQYLSGRLMSDKIVDGSKPFRVEIRAKVNWNGLKGTRPSLWMRNSEDLATCARNSAANSPYGELDILEWYSHMPEYTWSASHVTCFHSRELNTWRTRTLNYRLENRVNRRAVSLADDWHTWAVEYDGRAVRYYVDNEPVGVSHYRTSDTNVVKVVNPSTKMIDEKGRTPSSMTSGEISKLGVGELAQKVFNDKWYIILNDYVESKANLNPPSPTKRFPVQTFLIDYVRVYGEGNATTAISAVAPKTSGHYTPSAKESAASNSQASVGLNQQNEQPKSTAGDADRLADTGENIYIIAIVAAIIAITGGSVIVVSRLRIKRRR